MAAEPDRGAGTGDDELAKALFGNDTFTPINELTPARGVALVQVQPRQPGERI